MAEGRRINGGDVWSGAVLAALGVYIVVQARQWDYLAPDGPGPGFFPMWYGVALVVLSLAMVVSRLVRSTPSHAHAAVKWDEVWRALAAWAAFATGAALLNVLGFVLVYALLSVFVACVMYRRTLRTGVVTGALGAAIFYVVFALALEVTLPAGVLGF
jgi:putative tricarboxylic transport membrane protein